MPKKPLALCRWRGCKKLRYNSKVAFCSKHQYDDYKKRHPITCKFKSLRSNARRRGHEWTLTLHDFLELIEDTEFMTRRGRKITSLTLDRKDNRYGYHPWNVQILTYSDNSLKSKSVTWTPQPNIDPF